MERGTPRPDPLRPQPAPLLLNSLYRIFMITLACASRWLSQLRQTRLPLLRPCARRPSIQDERQCSLQNTCALSN